MTTPTNPDRLREIKEFYATDVEAAKEWHSFPPTKEGDVAFLLSVINKLKAEKAETIQVLEAFLAEGPAQMWRDRAKPLLDKLKGERKERVEHYRVGAGECACGFDAYKISGIMLDYGELLYSHIRRAKLKAES